MGPTWKKLARCWCCGPEADEDDHFMKANTRCSTLPPALQTIPQFVLHANDSHQKRDASGKQRVTVSACTARSCAELMAAGGKGGKCIEHDVVVTEALCLNHDVCVHGSVTVKASCCITGNVSIVGNLTVEPNSGGICVTGDVLVVGSVLVASDCCITGAGAVQGSLTVQEANVDITKALTVDGETRFIAKVNPE